MGYVVECNYMIENRIINFRRLKKFDIDSV